MSTRSFAEKNILLALVHAKGNTPEERKYQAIKMVDRAYTILNENWPVSPTRTNSNQLKPYTLLKGDQKKIFDQLWKLSGCAGDKQAASSAFMSIDVGLYAFMIPAYKKYLDSLGDTTRCHLSTWLNQERYLNFQVQVEEDANVVKINKDAQELASLKKLHGLSPSPALEEQIEKLEEKIRNQK